MALSFPFIHPDKKVWACELPKDGSTLVVVENDVFRFFETGTFESLPRLPEKPKEIEFKYITAGSLFIFENRPHLALLKGFGGDRPRLFRAGANNEFSELESPIDFKGEAEDFFVWDPLRQTLFLFALRGKVLHAYAWNGQGWKLASQSLPLPGRTFMGGFDRARKAIVVTNTDGDAFVFDGEKWAELPRHPGSPWHPAIFGQDPKSGRLVMFYSTRSTEVSSQLWRLDENQWTQLHSGPFLPSSKDAGNCASAVQNLEKPNSCFLLPLQKGSFVPRLFLGFDSETFYETGSFVIDPDGIVVNEDEVLVFKRSDIVGIDSQILHVKGEDCTAWKGFPEGLADIVKINKKFMFVANSGKLYEFENGGWKVKATPPPDFAPRALPAVAVHEGELWIQGGLKSDESETMLNDLWKVENGQYERLETSGAAPAFYDARFGVDPRTGDLFLVGGSNLSKDNSKLFIFSRAKSKWTSFKISEKVSGSIDRLGTWFATSKGAFGLRGRGEIFWISEKGEIGEAIELPKPSGILSYATTATGWDGTNNEWVDLGLAKGVRPLFRLANPATLGPAKAQSMVEAEAPERRFVQPLKKTKTVSETWIGAAPVGVTAGECGSCGTSLSHVITLQDLKRKLGFQKVDGLSVFLCNNPKGACETWQPDSKGSEVIRHATPVKAPQEGVIFFNGKEDTEADPESQTEFESIDKLGGFPSWLQNEEVPEGKDGKPMTFVAQINELSEEINFGGGMAYIFVAQDEESATMLWQS